jgi:putative sporulation protein YtaF
LDWLTVLLLAAALSLDSLSVGLLYGARRIRLPLGAAAIVSIASGLLLGLAMLGGSLVATYLPPHLAMRAGGLLLVGVGLWIGWGALRNHADELAAEAVLVAEPVPVRRVWRLKLGSAQVVVEILRSPSLADRDHSGTISLAEAGLLGLALALDSVAAGLGAGMAGVGFTLPLVATIASLLFLEGGSWVGKRLPIRLEGRWGAVHGLVLLALGLVRLVR